MCHWRNPGGPTLCQEGTASGFDLHHYSLPNYSDAVTGSQNFTAWNTSFMFFSSPYAADFIVNFTVQWDKCFPQTFLHIKYSGVIWTWLKYSLGPVLYHLSMQKILKSSGTMGTTVRIGLHTLCKYLTFHPLFTCKYHFENMLSLKPEGVLRPSSAPTPFFSSPLSAF